jgi:hypothetical protein
VVGTQTVIDRESGIARRLVAAGADPWRPQMNGWPPGRLNLAGPEPDLLGPAAVGATDVPGGCVIAQWAG